MRMQDIANEAKVSLGTVSRVLNNNPEVSEDLRKKVLKVAKAKKYTFNITARMLALAQKKQLSKTKGCFGLVISENIGGFRDEFFASILNGAIKESKELDVKVITDIIKKDYQLTIDLPKMIKDDSVDGIIIVALINKEFVSQLIKMQIPVVVIDDAHTETIKNTVLFDSFDGAYKATKYLIDSGHKKIGLLAHENLEFLTFRKRFEGYKSALESNGLTYDEKLADRCDLCIESGYYAMKRLLKKDSSITSVFAMNDLSAIGAMRAIEESGLKVPDDISIVGFDDIDLASQVRPGLTTIRVPKEELGILAVRKLYELVENKIDSASKTILEVKLIERDSVKKIGG